MANKLCKKCKQTKPLSDFYTTNTYKWELDGHDYYCKYCRSGAHLTSIRNQDKKCSVEECNNPHYAKSWCRMHYARVERNGTIVSKNGKGIKSNRDKMLRWKYDMTLKTFEERSANGCEICGDKTERSLHVDHDHKCCSGQKTCGKCVRGIICAKCNHGVDKMENGLMRADYPQYDNIKKYLEVYSG